MGLFSKISSGLKKTRDSFSNALDSIFTESEINDEFYEDLEEILIMSDIGVDTSTTISEMLKIRVKQKKLKTSDEVKSELRLVIADVLDGDNTLKLNTKPSIIIMIGVNGAGKTTTVGKLALNFKNKGKKVIIGAADTFRAAAIDQLDVWAKRADVEIVKQSEGSDPAAVVFDTISAAKARNCDIIICDTAGRLHTKKNLMSELDKINRIIKRELPDSDCEVLLVLDATTGQNALNQAKEFNKAAQITGVVLTKLDGTSKGGMVLSIYNELNIPVKLIGVGEGIDDLQDFDALQYAEGII